MQAAMQINTSVLSFQNNMDAHRSVGNRASSPLPLAAGSNGTRNLASQMSNMMGGFSKTSFSISSQTAGNGRTTTFSAQGTIINRAQAANPQPMRPGSNCNPSGYGNSSRTNSGFANQSRGCDRTPSIDHCGCNNSGSTNQAQWSNTAVCNNKASINLGDYKLDFDKSNSTMVMTNNTTGDKTMIYGDPHLTQHQSGSNSNSSTAMFNGPMTFTLPDNTKVTVNSQPDPKNKSISYADQVTITRGNQAYEVTGLSAQDKSGLSVQKSNNGRALDAATPDGFTLVAARDGSGFINPATGKEATPDEIKKANT
jgi:hypothetical protein